MSRLPRLLITALALLLPGLPAAAAPFTPGNVVVYRVGDGSAALSPNGNRVFLEERTPAGALVQTIDLPFSDVTNLVAGRTFTEGILTRSSDGRFLLIPGYNTMLPASGPVETTNSIPRIFGRMDRDGSLDLTTVVPFSDLPGEPRCATSPNGTDIWFTGGTSGVRYTTLGPSQPTLIADSPEAARQIQVVNGNLYIARLGLSTNVTRIAQVGSGLPTTYPQTLTAFPGVQLSPGFFPGFLLVDRSATVAGVDTLYVTDEGAGIIRKYSYNGTTWTDRGSIALASVRYLTGVVDASSVTLFATTFNTTFGTSALHRATDTAAFDATIAAPPTLIANAAANTAFRGVALAPVAASDVRLERFQALRAGGGTRLLWRTGWESENLGFYVYRIEGGERVRLNPELIAGSALQGGTQGEAGYGYAWADPNVGDGYLLEALDLRGNSTWHGPFSPETPSRAPPDARSPTLAAAGAGGFSGALFEGPVPRSLPELPPAIAPETLAGRAGIKIGVRREGLFGLTGAELQAAGLPAGVDARTLRLFTGGREVAIHLVGGNARRLAPQDFLLFYGVERDTPETDARTYWLTWGADRGRRMPLVAAAAKLPAGGGFPEALERRERSLYFAGLLNGPAVQNFFGPAVTATPLTRTIGVPDMAVEGGAGLLEVALQGVTERPYPEDHRVRVWLNGVDLGLLVFDGRGRGVEVFAVPPGLLAEGDNLVTLRAEGAAPDTSLLEHLRLSYSRRYAVRDGRLRFLASGGASLALAGVEPGAWIVDVTDAENPLLLSSQVEAGSLRVNVPGAGTRLLWAVQSPGAPADIRANGTSDWRGRRHRADLVILAPADLQEAVTPLQAAREAAGLRTLVVDPQDIYDEFGWGEPSPDAVRRFLHHAVTRWRGPPRFALLVGDATYDPRGYLGTADRQWVPTGSVSAGGLETASDDWLADFDYDGVPELAVGRLPVRGSAEGAAVVAKLLTLPGGGGGVFVSDLSDGFGFQASSEQAAGLFGAPATLLPRSLLGAGTGPALLSALGARPAFVAYSGHGSNDFWRGGVLDAAAARTLTPGSTASLWAAMTCLNGYFTSPTLECLAETLIRNPQAGAGAVWASSTYCSAETQAGALQAFSQALGSGATLGEAARTAKRAVHDRDLRASWILFGDPTVRLR